MALAWVRLGVSDDPAAVAVREAMLQHPDLIAGTSRFCTDVMRALPGQVIAKVGAEGIYSATLPRLGLGVALKVEDGDHRVAPTALLAIVRQLLHGQPADGMDHYASLPVRNTRREQVGEIRAAGALRVLAP
jgi:L-asparaginase II